MEGPLAGLDLRVRLFGRVLATSSVSKLDEARLREMQQGGRPRNLIFDWIFGRPAPGVSVFDDKAAGAEGPLAIRCYRPAAVGNAVLPLVINFHGGGWTLGNLDQGDWLCSHVAANARVVVVSVDYRLAPTFPFPAAAQDCYAALRDIVARPDEFGADTSRIAVMGDSAGGNLAAVVALRARDHGGPEIAFQALIYPATDLTMGSPSMEENANAPVLTKADVLAFTSHYLNGHDAADPLASPLLASSHRDLPRALIQVAEHDPLRDDGVRYAKALADAGGEVRLTAYDGMPHGFLSFPGLCRSARPALQELVAELRDALS